MKGDPAIKIKSQKINTIRKKFPKEWLLIAVDRINEFTQPISGRLLAHSPSRDEIYTKSLHPYKSLIYIAYAEKKLPKGYAAAF